VVVRDVILSLWRRIKLILSFHPREQRCNNKVGRVGRALLKPQRVVDILGGMIKLGSFSVRQLVRDPGCEENIIVQFGIFDQKPLGYHLLVV
jgi:hypothetical protein